MKAAWPLVRLGDYLRVKHGFAFQGTHFADHGDYIVLTPGNFHDEGGFKPKAGAEKYYSAEPPDEYVLGSDDLVIAMTEQVQGLLGSSALIPCDGVYLHNQRIGLVELSPQIERRFIYYLFNTSAVRDQIQATATGSKVRHTAPSRVEAVTVRLPPLPIQRKIACVLSAYDDLIENNNRRIKLLVETVQRIYREWFVDCRYPGHADVPLADSHFGPIPQGWAGATIQSCSTLLSRGVSPEYDEHASQVVVNQRCIRHGQLSMSLARRHATRVPPEKIIRHGDVLINSTGVGTLGRVAQVLTSPIDTTVDSHVSIVRHNLQTTTKMYWGLSLMAREADFEAMGLPLDIVVVRLEGRRFKPRLRRLLHPLFEELAQRKSLTRRG